MMRCFYIIFASFFATSAMAHGGHVGELAGHAHWIGLAAALGAGVIAAALLRGTKKKDADDAENQEAAELDDDAGEPA